MLALVLLFLVALIISVPAIWLWRLVANQHGLTRSSPAKPATKTRMRLKAQQDFISSTNRSSKGSTKTPWGW